LARRILLADDSVTAQNMGRRILTDAGYEVVTVNNGSAALKKIAENKPDLIVLDVYMPGYGGLEVCQRVKESPETRQIPVLLTVGKLEPFKAEEARRVGADSFIIKPFEATELLTVLTKLEDKIVAQPQPQKSGRFAKALAAVEQSDTRERFGDKETGWKNRLTIPSPQAKTQPEEEASETMAATSPGSESRGPEQREAAKSVTEVQGFERPIPAGLPADITPEEIAAITAAAASFDGKTEPPSAMEGAFAAEAASSPEVASPEAAAFQPSSAEAPAATQAAATEASQEIQAEVPPEIISEAVVGAAAEKAADHPTEDRPSDERAAASDLLPAAAFAEITASPEAQTSEPAQSTAGDAEVMAAIASLAPTNGHSTENIRPGAYGSSQTGHELTASGFVEAASGPRWIAESVEVGLEESKVALEQEMEQVHAARALVEAANLSVATEAIAASLVAVAEPVESAIAGEASVAESAALTEPLPAVAETSVVESGVVESSVVESSVVDSMPAESGMVEASTVEGQVPAVVAEQSAYAAAASAGPGTEHTTSVEAVSATNPAPQNHSTSQGETAPQREAGLAAAWQNWKQIRESLVDAPPPPAADASAGLNSRREEPALPVQPASADLAEPAEVEAAAVDTRAESTAIASIVDTMLAELRPKLVEEIAKKMNSEKKEKDKKKKK
jgi:CheY-like chemotaxis protein